MIRIQPEIQAENGLMGAFDAIMGKYFTSTPKPYYEPLNRSQCMFLMGLQADLETAKLITPNLTKELDFLNDLIAEELR